LVPAGHQSSLVDVDRKLIYSKQEVPPLAIGSAKALEDFRRYHIETALREKFELIWLIGFRDKNDNPTLTGP
jgi:hypothetical protein